MWVQSWVVTAANEETATNNVKAALRDWTPQEQEAAEVTGVRIYRGPDDLAISEAIAQALAEIRQTVVQGHRQELSRRLHSLAQRPIGIPPMQGWVVLDGTVPRSPRPLDLRGTRGPRWVVTVSWPGDVPIIEQSPVD